MEKFVEAYLENLNALIQAVERSEIENVIQMFSNTRKNKNRIFVLGNGGSASHANHFACDLGKNVTRDENSRFKIISVCENLATITAYANDIHYESIFSEQLKNYDIESGDIVLAISASGNSPNVIQGAEYAKLRGAKIIGFVGFDGGRLKQISDICLHVPSNEYEKVEDVHLTALHIIVSYFKNGGE